MDNIKKVVDSFQGAYPCSGQDSGNYLVHGAYNMCPFCKDSKGLHLKLLISNGVSLILTGKNVHQPWEDVDKEEPFSIPAILSALAITYPGHLSS